MKSKNKKIKNKKNAYHSADQLMQLHCLEILLLYESPHPNYQAPQQFPMRTWNILIKKGNGHLRFTHKYLDTSDIFSSKKKKTA